MCAAKRGVSVIFRRCLRSGRFVGRASSGGHFIEEGLKCVRLPNSWKPIAASGGIYYAFKSRDRRVALMQTARQSFDDVS